MMSDAERKYFGHLAVLNEASRLSDVRTLVEHSLASLPHVVPMFLASPYAPTTIPCFEYLCRFCPLTLDGARLLELKHLREQHSFLGMLDDHLPQAFHHFVAARWVAAELSLGKTAVQSDLVKVEPAASTVCYWWHQFKLLVRAKEGRSFRVSLLEVPSPSVISRLEYKMSVQERNRLFKSV